MRIDLEAGYQHFYTNQAGNIFGKVIKWSLFCSQLLKVFVDSNNIWMYEFFHSTTEEIIFTKWLYKIMMTCKNLWRIFKFKRKLTCRQILLSWKIPETKTETTTLLNSWWISDKLIYSYEMFVKSLQRPNLSQFLR